jgi:hypothetical protein
MRIRRIPDFVDGFYSCIYSSIKTNGKICAGNIFIYGAR